ncbi:MAG: hypothetical protein HQ582_09350 [Planctomycetes bacterium]|nr:hypothetical protein [Planctomycetota bacterium]
MRHIGILGLTAFVILHFCYGVSAQDQGQSMQTWVWGEDEGELLKSKTQRMLEEYENDDSRTVVDEIWDARTKIGDLTRKRAETFNRLNDDLTKEREPIAADINFFNNVVSLRKKDDLDRWIEDRKATFNREGGERRIGIINPYDNTKYYRYYNEKGDLIVSEVRNSYELIEEQKADWDKTYKRAQYAAETIQNDYESMIDSYGKIMTLQAMIAERRQREAQQREAERREAERRDDGLYDLQNDPPLFGPNRGGPYDGAINRGGTMVMP